MMKKKLLTLVLASILCFSFSGCAGGCSSNDSDAEAGDIITKLSGKDVAMTSGSIRLDFYQKDKKFGFRVVDLAVLAGGGAIDQIKKTAPTAASIIYDEMSPVHVGFKPVAADGDLMNIYTKEYFVDAPYDSVSIQDYGIKASATVTGNGGGQVLVIDRYFIKSDGTFTLDRVAEVLSGNDKKAEVLDEGFSTKVSINLGDDTTISDYQVMIPAIMYQDGQKLAGNAIGAGTSFRYMYIKETRLGMPFVVSRHNESGYTVAMSHVNPSISSGIDESAAFTWEVSDKIHYGSIGFNSKKGENDALQMDFVYPCSEGDMGYGGKSWTHRHHPVTKGVTHFYQVGLSFAKTESYTAAATDMFKTHFKLTDHTNFDVDMKDVYDAQVDMWNETMREITTVNGVPQVGVPWAFSVPSGKIDGWTLESGFVGQQTQVAYQVLSEALERGDKDKIVLASKAVSFWTDCAQIKTGDGAGLMKTRYDGAVARYDSQHYPIFLRTMNDGYEGILNAARAIKAYADDSRYADMSLGALADKWFESCELYAEFLLRKQNADGSLYRAYNHLGEVELDDSSPEAGNGKLSGDSKNNTIMPARFLGRMYEYKVSDDAEKANEYKAALLKACEFSYNEMLMPFGTFIGGTVDQSNLVDKEAGVFAMYGFSAAYQLTGEKKWLDAAEYAAVFAISWTYTYDFRVPDDDPANTFRFGGVAGMSMISTGHSGSDNYNAFIYNEVYKLYAYTGDDFYAKAGEFIGTTTKRSLDMDGAKGYKYKTLALEATTVCDFTFRSVNAMLTWVGVANSEPIDAFYRTFGTYNISDLSETSYAEIKQMVDAYGIGGKTYNK